MSDEPAQDELLAVALEAARAAAAELMPRWRRNVGAIRSKSTPTDPVSAADVAAEEAIRDVLGRRRAGDRVLGEEGGSTGSGDALRWIVDPLDGTVNYLYGIDQFAVSIACEDSAGGIVGVVLDPVRDEVFAATRSGPPTLNGETVAPERPTELGLALVSTGFGYDPAIRTRQAEVAARVIPRARDIRRAGSAALDLCWCACGRLDAYYERGIRPWDYAAGALVCARAELSIRHLAAVADGGGARADLPAGLLVAPPAFVDELEALVGEPSTTQTGEPPAIH